jgi:hypothetical protein
VKIEVVRRIKEEMNVLHKIKRRKADGIGHILCRKCLKKRIIDGKVEGWMEGEGRRGRRLKQPLHDRKEMKTQWKLNEETPERTLENSLWKRLWSCRKTE